MVALTTLVVCASCVAGGVAVVGDKVFGIDDVNHRRRAESRCQRVLHGLGGRGGPAQGRTCAAHRARLVKGDVPPFQDNVPDLVRRLRDQGLSHVVVPTVAPVGSGVRMSVVIYLAGDGTIVKTFTRNGRPDAMGTLAREVAAEVRGWLGEPSPVVPEVASAFQPTAEALGVLLAGPAVQRTPGQAGLARTGRDRCWSRSWLMQPGVRRGARRTGTSAIPSSTRLTPAPELVIRAQDALGEAQRQGGDLEEVLLGLAQAKHMTGRPDEAVAVSSPGTRSAPPTTTARCGCLATSTSARGRTRGRARAAPARLGRDSPELRQLPVARHGACTTKHGMTRRWQAFERLAVLAVRQPVEVTR